MANSQMISIRDHQSVSPIGRMALSTPFDTFQRTSLNSRKLTKNDLMTIGIIIMYLLPFEQIIN